MSTPDGLDYRLTRLEEKWYKKQQFDVDEIERLKAQYREMQKYFNMGFMEIIRHKLLRWLDVFNPRN